tara:strand:+ start:170 stop:619 length:450 start_codon:yes stop_codon:yes gene_type:complete
MNFEDFENSFTKENRALKIALATTLIVSVITCLMILFQKKYFLYQGKDIFEERPLAVEICRLGFISLAKGEPNPHVVTDEIIDLVKKEPFSMEVDRILKLESLEKGACKIILKSSEELLSFKIGLEESILYPFHYKLIQLDEVKAQEAF